MITKKEKVIEIILGIVCAMCAGFMTYIMQTSLAK